MVGIPPPRKRKLVETTQQIREKLPLVMPKKDQKIFPCGALAKESMKNYVTAIAPTGVRILLSQNNMGSQGSKKGPNSSLLN